MLNRAPLILLLFPLLCPAEENAGWQALEQLKPETILSIGTRQHRFCRLTQVTDSALECAQFLRTGERFVVFQRSDVDQIRLAFRKPTRRLRNTLISAAAGEALGVAWAHASAGLDPIGADPGKP